jgi:tetratricopeptide (TPR) repeat protein
MFKRFQTPKAPPPFPPIEEDISCPQCGFNHDGWAFEPGHAKLCVKCGRALESPEVEEDPEDRNSRKPGFFGRILGGMLGAKKEEPAGVEPVEEEEPTSPAFEAREEPTGERVILAEPAARPEAPEHPPHDTPNRTDSCNEPPGPEAAHVGACKREGRLLAKQGRYDEAVQMLEKVVAFEPNDVESWGELGRIHYTGTKDLSKAIECSRRALEIDEDLVWVKCNLCLTLLFDGQFDLAKKGFLEVIRSVRNSRGYDEEFQANCKALLHDCLGELYVSKKEASGERLAHIKDIIELLEIEKIYFH